MCGYQIIMKTTISIEIVMGKQEVFFLENVYFVYSYKVHIVAFEQG